MKRFISVLLVSVMLLSLMTACASEDKGKDKPTDPSVTTTAPTGETTEPVKEYEKDELPELDYNGKTVVILSPDSIGATDEITVESLTSDVVNDSIYNRERYVEERLGVEIVNLKVDP
ncbi:MAG: hypothetical protein IKV54_07980, partial [Clostridia bacterium]|nr:hypothetical protein [Clostridia bacterium]